MRPDSIVHDQKTCPCRQTSEGQWKKTRHEIFPGKCIIGIYLAVNVLVIVQICANTPYA